MKLGDDVHTTVVFAIMRTAGVPATAADMAKEIAAQAVDSGVDVVGVEGAAIMWRPKV